MQLYVWLSILSFIIAGVMVVLFMVLRQIGILLNTVGPVGARTTHQGPRVGENIYATTRRHFDLEWERPTLLIFGSLSCPICEVIKQAVIKLQVYWKRRVAFVFIYDWEEKPAPGETVAGMPLFFNSEFRNELDIKMLPFALMADTGGKVLGQGLVNDISNIESLLELISDDLSIATSLREKAYLPPSNSRLGLEPLAPGGSSEHLS